MEKKEEFRSSWELCPTDCWEVVAFCSAAAVTKMRETSKLNAQVANGVTVGGPLS
jgi:hypothetical protein